MHKPRFAWCLVFVILFCAAVTAQDRIDVSNTTEILISSVRTSERFGKKQKGDEALLIRDKSEIAKFVSLLNNNLQGKVHACGYHWRLLFYRQGSATTEIYFNEDCEEFERNTAEICQTVQAAFNKTVTRPNAFLTTLKIDAAVPPETVEAELAAKNRMRVLSFRKTDRLPRVELVASATSSIPDDQSLLQKVIAATILEADRFLVNDIARVREKLNTVEIGEIYSFVSRFGGGNITEERRVTLYFPIGTDLAAVGTGLNKSKVGETLVPTTYNLQVLTPSRLTKSERDELIKSFSFVKAIEPH
jgi:hypothetical protein